MKRLFGIVFAPLGLMWVLVLAFLVTFLIMPFAWLPRGRRERYAIWGARWFCWMCLRPVLFVRETVVGREHLPRSGGYLVVSNHRSWADVLMLILHTSSQGISKKEVTYLPFFGMNGHYSGALFFDRKDPADRARVAEDAKFLLASGANLHLFPEGTRSRDGHIREKVHLRLVQQCWEQGIPVVPACVWGTENVLPATYFAAYIGGRLGLELAPAVPRDAWPNGEAYADAVWARVREMAKARGADEPFSEVGGTYPPNSTTTARREPGAASA